MELFGVDTRLLYTLLVVLVAGQRLLELRVARRNVARLLAQGGREVGAGHYPVMVALHTAFLIACPLEVWLLRRPFVPLLAAVMGVLLLLAMALRTWVIRSLGGRWTTRVIVLPGVPAVAGGPFRWLRHPNYLAVATEMVALPLVHTAWLTAAVFSIANALLLAFRIRTEEEALAEASDYHRRLGDTPRLVPGRRQRDSGEP